MGGCLQLILHQRRRHGKLSQTLAKFGSMIPVNSPMPRPMPIHPATGYAGDISPQLACQWWQAGEAVLIDVRTDAEREWVGFVPGALPAAWKLWPGMVLNPAFDDALNAAMRAATHTAQPPGKKALMLCRSGIRSIAAARRATELGFEAYNILEGFEGDPDAQAHRGVTGGWRHLGLPWRQG